MARKKPDQSPKSSTVTETGRSLVPRSGAEGSLEGPPQTLRDLYDRWLRSKLAHATWRADWRRRSDTLGAKARYLRGTLEAARRFVAASDAVDGLAAGAELDCDAAARALEEERAAETRRFQRESRAFAKALGRMADRYAEHYVVPLRFRVHPIQAKSSEGRCVVQVDEIGPDDAVLLVRALTGKLPTRYGFYNDDAVTDLGGPPARWYVEDGVPAAILDDVERADREVGRRGGLLAVRTMIPIRVPGHDFPRFRIVARGRVGELESRGEGAPYANRIAPADLELLSGYLISLRFAGRVAFEVEWPVPER